MKRNEWFCVTFYGQFGVVYYIQVVLFFRSETVKQSKNGFPAIRSNAAAWRQKPPLHAA